MEAADLPCREVYAVRGMTQGTNIRNYSSGEPEHGARIWGPKVYLLPNSSNV